MLGVSTNASQSAIKRAYRKKAKSMHPDVNKAWDASDKFKQLKKAYEVLGSVSGRKEYDDLVARKRSAAASRTSSPAASRTGTAGSSYSSSTATATRTNRTAEWSETVWSGWGMEGSMDGFEPARHHTAPQTARAERTAASPFSPAAPVARKSSVPAGATRRFRSDAYSGDDFEAIFVVSEPAAAGTSLSRELEYDLGQQYSTSWDNDSSSSRSSSSRTASSSGPSSSSSSSKADSTEGTFNPWQAGAALTGEEKDRLLDDLQEPYKRVAEEFFGPRLRDLMDMEDLVEFCESVEGLRSCGIPIDVAVSAVSLTSRNNRKRNALANADRYARFFLAQATQTAAQAAATATAAAASAAGIGVHHHQQAVPA